MPSTILIPGPVKGARPGTPEAGPGISEPEFASMYSGLIQLGWAAHCAWTLKLQASSVKLDSWSGMC
jgi:hypothetical protein